MWRKRVGWFVLGKNILQGKMMIQTDITKAAAFTGHRFIRYSDRQRLETNLERAITACYQSGIRHFLCGMALGFDMLAAETLLAMKADHADIRLTAVIPFRGQPCKFNPADKGRYQSILGKADNVVCQAQRLYAEPRQPHHRLLQWRAERRHVLHLPQGGTHGIGYNQLILTI